MLTLVGAGHGIDFTTTARMETSQRTDVVTRPLAMDSAVITTAEPENPFKSIGWMRGLVPFARSSAPVHLRLHFTGAQSP